MSKARRIPIAALCALLAVAALAAAVGASLDAEPAWPPLPGPRAASLLAVGDVGDVPWRVGYRFQTQMRVARAISRADVRAPADALVFLGDLFYPDGLRGFELEARVRGNLAVPYCRFLPLDGVGCPFPRRPARVLAVLGNHDYYSEESPRLTREEVPRLLPALHVLPGAVEVVELPQGLSLVLYDPHLLLEAGDFEPLREAVRAARGPWRILVSHYPLTMRRNDVPGRAARAALAGLDVPIHLHLAGHRHYLELARNAEPPFLQAAAGSGATARKLKEPFEGSLYQGVHPGFARVDLVRAPGGDRLLVSLVALPDAFLALWQRPRLVARASVGRAGDTREEPLAAP